MFFRSEFLWGLEAPNKRDFFHEHGIKLRFFFSKGYQSTSSPFLSSPATQKIPPRVSSKMGSSCSGTLSKKKISTLFHVREKNLVYLGPPFPKIHFENNNSGVNPPIPSPGRARLFMLFVFFRTVLF